jgi:hypothetical protein
MKSQSKVPINALTVQVDLVLRPNNIWNICESSGGRNDLVNSGRIGLAMIHNLEILGQLEKLCVGLG